MSMIALRDMFIVVVHAVTQGAQVKKSTGWLVSAIRVILIILTLNVTISNREVDTNLDGILSDEEFRAFFDKGCKRNMEEFDGMDTNRDNHISAEEFVASGVGGVSEEEAIRKWLESRKMIDKTGDDMLSLEEIWITRGRRVC